MKKLVANLVLLSVITVAPVAAQTTGLSIAPRVGYDVGGDIEEAFVGVEARTGIGDLPVLFNAAFDYYFAEDPLTFFQLALNALYEFGVDNQAFTPYAGAGLSINRVSVDIDTPFGGGDVSSTDVGFNILGGAWIEMNAVRPFAQVQYTVSDFDLLTIAVGVMFSL